MGNDTKKKNQQTVIDTSNQLIKSGMATTPNFSGQQDNLNNMNASFRQKYEDATADQTRDYGDIMQNYKNLYGLIGGTPSTKFNWNDVSYSRPGELNESFDTLRQAGAGYKGFADTGGYSAQDIQELRARGISPIRAAYGNTIRELDRSRSLGGGASNYIAARSRAQRELPQQMADATTTVNAQLADAIRQGKLAGLAGMSGVGSTMGGLSADEASKILQAQITNSQGNLQAQGMDEQSRQAKIAAQMGILSGQGNLYGTTPGRSSMFGNQVLQGMGLTNQSLANQSQYGLGQTELGLNALGGNTANQGTPWWKTALAVAGTVAPYVAMMSDRNLKEDISEPIDNRKIVKGLKRLNLHKWKYRGDSDTHIGPMAQDFKKHLGVGDGKTLHLSDVMGVMLAAAKEMA